MIFQTRTSRSFTSLAHLFLNIKGMSILVLRRHFLQPSITGPLINLLISFTLIYIYIYIYIYIIKYMHADYVPENST